MKQSIILLFSAIMLLMLGSCDKIEGEGPVVTQFRTIENFKGVSSGIGGKVIYKVGPAYKVEVQAQQNILNILETVKNGDELLIKFKDGKNVKSHEHMLVIVSAPIAEWVNLSGSGEFSLEGDVNTANFNLRVSGSGNLRAEKLVLTDKLTASISGSGNITVLAGSAKNESFKISGSGNIHAQDLVAEKAVTEISGSGHIRLNLTQTLDASISGSGSVFYRGTPQVSTHISGSGSVTPL